MKDYDFDSPIKDYTALIRYRWEENASGERSLEYVTGSLLWGIGFSGVTAGVAWFAFAWFVPMLENYQRIGIFTGGCLFCVGGFVAGWLFDRYVRSKGPLVILKPDKTIVLHRLRQTIIPEPSTHFELIKSQGTPHQRRHLSHFDLILWHQNQTYYVASGYISTFGKEPNTPLEKLYADLCETYPFEGMKFENRKESHDQAIERQRKKGRRLLLFVTGILGLTFSLLGGSLLWKCLIAESQAEMGAIVASSVFFGIGMIVLFVFLYNLMRTLQEHGNYD